MSTSRVTILIEAKDRASREIAQAEGAMGKLRATWKSAAIVATAMTAAVLGTAAAFDKLATRGGEVLNLSRAFTKMVGDQEAALATLRGATRGLVSDYELMKQANTALALGSANNVEEFKTLAETATALGRSLGLDTAFAINSLNIGIARQSRLVLDNVGLIVDVEKANQAYAKSLKKSASALTDAERGEAFRIATMEAARQKLEQLGGITETNADNIQRMKTAVVNAKDAFAEWVAESPAIGNALDEVGRKAGDAGGKLSEMAEGMRLLRYEAGQLEEGLRTNPITGEGGWLDRLLGAKPSVGTPTVTIGPATPLPGFARPGAPIAPSAPVPGAPNFAGVPTLGEAFMGLDSNWAGRFERPVDIQTPDAHGRFHSGLAPKGLSASQVAMAGSPHPLLKEADQALDGMNAAAMAAVGSLHALGLAAMDGSLGLDDFAASLGNVIGSAIGGPWGALIGAVGSLAGAAFSDDKPMNVRMTDVSDRAASKLTEKREGPDVQVFLNGNLATPEELAALGYRLKRQSRLRGESVGGM